MYHFPSYPNRLKKELFKRSCSTGIPRKYFRKSYSVPYSAAFLLFRVFVFNCGSAVTVAAQLTLHCIYRGRFARKLKLHRAAPSSSLSDPSLAARAVGSWNPPCFPLNLENEERAERITSLNWSSAS